MVFGSKTCGDGGLLMGYHISLVEVKDSVQTRFQAAWQLPPLLGAGCGNFKKTSGAQKIAGIWVKRVINPLDFEVSQWCILVTRVTVSRGAIHAIHNALATGSHPNLSQPRAEFVS